MKKLLALVFLFMAAGAYAGIDFGLETGQTRVGVYGGMSVPSAWDVNGASVHPGNTGLMLGAEFVRNLTPEFALGIDADYAAYGDKNSGGTSVNSRIFGGHITGRVNFFPDMPTRIYIPVAAGLSKLDSDFGGSGVTQTGPSFFTGVGVEFDLGPEWTLGLEGRYFYMPLDSDKFGDSNFSSINMLLKLGARF